MHIDIIDDLNFIIFLNNMQINNIDFSKKDDIENYLKKLFINLKKFYDIEVNGFYNIIVYIDKNYGIVLKIQKEDIDYLDYLDGQIDMSIIIKNDSIFLYKIDNSFNINKNINKKIKIYHYKNEFYVQIINPLTFVEIGKIIEYSRIIYDKAEKIIQFGKEINIELFQ